MITTFIKTVIEQLATAGIPEPAATMYSAAEPEIVRGILTVEYRKEIDNICLGNGALLYACNDAYQKFSNGDPAGALVEVFNAAGKPLPSYMATPATVCNYTYSNWSTCQAANMQTRTVISSSSNGCVGTPVLTQSCISACTYAYSDWSACQPDNTQARTVISSSPVGCTGTPVLSQSCMYVSQLPGDVILTATPGCDGTTSGIWLAWSQPGNADNYNIYRNGNVIITSFLGAQYTDNEVIAGTYYNYYVKAVNSYGSTPSNVVTVMAKGCTASPFQGNITGSWTGTCPGLGSGSGSFSMSVSANGSVTGSYSGDASGSISGSVNTSGNLSASGSASGASWTGNFSIIGSALSGDGSWSGSGCSGGWSGMGGLTQ
jgi:hypothetical protein